MNVICWNIQKINLAKAKTHGLTIATHVAPYLKAPYVFFILENKCEPDDVLNVLAKSIQKAGKRVGSVGWLHLGGNSSRQEYLLALWDGGDLEFKLDEDWHGAWKDSTETLHAHKIEMEEERVESLEKYKKFRQSTLTRAEERVDLVEADTFREASDFRQPAVCQFTTGDTTPKRYSIACLHAPGPSDGQHDEKYASLYFDAVMGSLSSKGIEIVMGDFNLYESRDQKDDLLDQSKFIGSTTLAKEDTLVDTRNSRLDRVYARKSVTGMVTAFGPTDRAVSDHLGVAYTNIVSGQSSSALGSMGYHPYKQTSTYWLKGWTPDTSGGHSKVCKVCKTSHPTLFTKDLKLATFLPSTCQKCGRKL